MNKLIQRVIIISLFLSIINAGTGLPKDNQLLEMPANTDTSGIDAFTQNMIKNYPVFIEPESHNNLLSINHNTKIICDNATGGDCTSIGTWDSSTRTCTLTEDFDGRIQILSNHLTLDGNGYSSHITNGYDGVSGITIENFISSSIYMRDHGYSTDSRSFIKNNELSKGGITLDCCRNISISNNIISHNNGSGIEMRVCRDAINITGNIINNNIERGIVAWDGDIRCITGNIINNNSHGILLISSYCDDIINNNICNNINEGVHFSCYSYAKNLIDNTILNNEKGIHLTDPYPYEGQDYKIINNNISNNNYGIYINYHNSHIYQNNLINNIINNAYDESNPQIGPNQWDNGIKGNYWSDFDETSEGCIDVNNNGICDSPYYIPGGSGIDMYPLVEPCFDWKNEWMGEDSDGGIAITTIELQDAIHRWLEDIPVRGYVLSTADLKQIIAEWL